jgi:hypothetical protein
MARNFAMSNDDGPENKASRAAKDGLVGMSNEHIEALHHWSAGQANIPGRRRIMVSRTLLICTPLRTYLTFPRTGTRHIDT